MALPGSRLHATALTYKAHGHALAREPEAALNALDEARSLAAAADGEPSPWATWLDEAYVDVQRGRCLALLGSHGQAAHVFQQAICGLPASFRRDRGVYLAREAQAHAGAGDPDQAAATGMRALGIAEETGSGRIVNELAALDARMARWAGVPAVISFRDALTSVIPQETDIR
jgi:tetratricopeptide (TPR) repeat protein